MTLESLPGEGLVPTTPTWTSGRLVDLHTQTDESVQLTRLGRI